MSHHWIPCWTPLHRTILENIHYKMYRYCTFNLVHTTIPNYNLSNRNISTHSLWIFEFFLWSKLNVTAFLLRFSTPRPTKRKPSGRVELHTLYTMLCKPPIKHLFNFHKCIISEVSCPLFCFSLLVHYWNIWIRNTESLHNF